MTKKIAIFLLGILIIVQFSGCAVTEFISNLAGGPEKIARFVTENKIARAQNVDLGEEIKILDLSRSNPALIITKSAIANSKESVTITPQTSGKITDIKINLGSNVNTGTLLITLGNSLSTDIAEIQYQTALQALATATNSETITNDTSRKSVQTSALGVKMAYESYQAAIKAQNNAEDIYDEQRSGTKSGKTAAKDAKNSIEDSLSALANTISELETQKTTLSDTLSQLEPSDPSYEEIAASLAEVEAALTAAKEQKAALEASLKTAENGLDQAQSGLDLLEISYEAQQDQLEFAVFAAEKQYEIAVKQFEMAANAAELQNLGIQTQVLQLDSAAKIAELSNEQKYIRSPINGIVTEIQVTENNFVAPGQPIAKIENPDTLLIKTSLNSEEIQFVTSNQAVTINFGSTKTTGNITSINQALNPFSKKIDVEIEAENPNKIPPGSLVKVDIPANTNNRIFVPLNSIYNNDQGQFVKTVNQSNQVKFSYVQLGETIREYIEITAGLTKKEKVIITPNTLLKENEIATIK